MFTRLAVVRPDVQKVLDKLTGVPVDIEPTFPTAAQLVAELTGDRGSAAQTRPAARKRSVKR
jgi:hypothetical protein